jgi:hypothetical protein
LPRHEFVGSGSVTDNTGHGLKRVTLSVMLPVSQCRKSRWRRGDMMIRGGNWILTVQGYLGLLDDVSKRSAMSRESIER